MGGTLPPPRHNIRLIFSHANYVLGGVLIGLHGQWLPKVGYRG
jgi:hypothetical protein